MVEVRENRTQSITAPSTLSASSHPYLHPSCSGTAMVAYALPQTGEMWYSRLNIESLVRAARRVLLLPPLSITLSSASLPSPRKRLKDAHHGFPIFPLFLFCFFTPCIITPPSCFSSSLFCFLKLYRN
ncbi:hypothetical protein BDZ94DRAFT_1277072 [Collybia nuda]|nr:hypothetical protein BDZ94DRAFT_1277072 [Collybia nuda]